MCDSGPQTNTEDQPPTLAEIVREVTDNGRTIINFLHDVMDGRLEGFQPCHRLDAARQLAKLGDKKAIAFLKSFSRAAIGRKPSRSSGESVPNEELAEIVNEVTSGGRDIVRFLVDAMHGKLDGFKPCHRISAAKELLRIGFYNVPVDIDDEDDENDDPISQAQLENQTCHNAKQYNDDDDPFDFDNYDREDYIRDRMGHRAEVHIFGSEEAREVALHTAREFGRESRAAGHIGDYDYSPIENPEDDPYGKGCYGYRVLRIGFQNNNVIRAINKAVAEYHKRNFKHLIDEDGSLTVRADTVSLDPRTLQYLERSRHLLAEENGKPPVGPDSPSSVTPEHPQDSPVGAGFKPARGLTNPSTERHTDPGEEPPGRRRRRKKPRKIHLGPSDEDPPGDSPRQRGDPGDIRIPLRNVLSVSASPL